MEALRTGKNPYRKRPVRMSMKYGGALGETLVRVRVEAPPLEPLRGSRHAYGMVTGIAVVLLSNVTSFNTRLGLTVTRKK